MFYGGIYALNSLPLSEWADLNQPSLSNGAGGVNFNIDNNYYVAISTTEFNTTSYSVITTSLYPMASASFVISTPNVTFSTFTGSTIRRDIQSLDPGSIITLFVLDLTLLGDSIYRFHSGTNEMYNPVVWQGETYQPMPIEASGFEVTTQGQLPRPMLKVANITGMLGAVVRSLDDLVGGKVTRKRTFKRYLDSVNFVAGNPLADPNQYFPDEVFYVNRKVSENKVFIEFELASAMDVHGIKIPRRIVVQNTCQWRYRGSECGYAGGAVADQNDTPTSEISQDKCGKRLSSCKLRFGEYGVLPYGGFPAAGLLN